MTVQSSVFFITGTDTDAGKTFVSCGILEAANLAGYSTAALKPLAAGGVRTDAGIQNEDALALQQQCNLPLSYQQINPVCLELAVAPHIAAQTSGVTLEAEGLAHLCNEVLQMDADITLIEGAGGWKVPLNNTEFISDLVKALNVPVILVVAMRLGCINHALLSAQAILADGSVLAGWIANQTVPAMPVYQQNIETLEKMLPAPLLAEISYEENFSQNSSCAKEINITKILSSIEQ